MLQDKPKKTIDYAHPTKAQLFWRIQKQCARRSITVFLMYMVMSMLMLALQAIDSTTTLIIELVLGVICILGGFFFNGHLCYHCGKDHYDHYLNGCIRRKNEAYGIQSGGEHRPEREYRVWKGFLIGLYVGLFVLVFGILAATFGNSFGGSFAFFILLLFSGWVIIPIGWIKDFTGATVSLYWSLLFTIIPVLISGAFYIIGAMQEKKIKKAEEERQRKVKEAADAAKERVREQTEEQRRKTLQSKKKK